MRPVCLLPLLLSTSLASLASLASQSLHIPPDLAHQGLVFPPGLPSHLTRRAEPPPTPGDLDILNLFLQYIAPQGQNISDVCKAASDKYLLGILNADPLALKMFDASAKLPPAGMLTSFITQHPGTFDSCLEVQSEELTGQHCLLTTYGRQGPPAMARRAAGPPGTDDSDRRYHLQQAMASKMLPQHLRHWTKEEEDPAAAGSGLLLAQGMLKLGRCVPSACSPEDVAQGFLNFLESAGVDMAPFMVVPLNCHTAEEEIPIEAGDWAMIAVIAFFAVLVTVGTVVDSAVNILHLEGVFSDKTIQLVQGFSLYTNTLKLFHCPEPNKPGSLDCINGIRFISMTWVLLGHGYSNFAGPVFVNNLMDFFAADGPFAGAPAFAAVSNAFPSVDSFFLIGATLLAFITLKELDKTQGGGAKFWIMYFVHRYIRLTGLYAIVIGLHATLLKFFATGIQSYAVTASVTPCQDYWWSNFLYINNLNGFEWMGCMGQTWYMANDMQFFVTSPFIIFALWKSPKFGLALLGLLLTAFTAIPTVLGFVRDWPFSPMLAAGGADIGAYMADFYIVPWCRYQPYLVGLGLGYLLYRMKDQPRLKLNPIALTWIWAVAFAVGSAVVYGLVSYQPYVADPMNPEGLASTAERAIYGGFHRLAWSLALAWVILACVKGAGGPVNSILSWSLWVPLARMSYSIYLVHMTVMVVVQQYASYRVDVSQVYIIYYLIFVLALCVALSYALVVLFEAPIVHLEKLLYYSMGIAKLPPVRRVKTE